VTIPAATLERFWAMLAHYHGQIWNASEFGRSFGVSDTTVRRYLDLLSATFVVRVLLPWSESLGKRQVRSPKVYLADSGLPSLGWDQFLERFVTTFISPFGMK
jgi:predicted AAA+ superfamily ATPase